MGIKDVFVNNADKESKLKKEEKKKNSDSKFIKAMFKILVVIWALLIASKIYKNNELFESVSIYQKVGNSDNGYSVTISDALGLEQNVIKVYKDLLQKGDYENAYKLLSKEYRDYATLEDFIVSLKGIDFSTMQMTEAKQKSQYSYVLGVTYYKNNEQFFTKYLAYPENLEQQQFSLSPDGFVYSYKDKKLSNDGIEIQIDEVVAYIDHVSIRGSIKNTEWNKDVDTLEIAVSYNESLNKWIPFQETIKAGETAQFDLVAKDTNYFIPNKILVKRQKEDVSRIYIVNLEENT